MGQYGKRPPQGPVPRSVYWQRRVLVLVLGVCLPGLLAVSVSGMLSSGAEATRAAKTPSARPSGTVRAHSSLTRQPSPTPALPGPGGRRACAASSVVLSLFTSRYWYRSGQKPRFAVDVVSVARRPCRFKLGAGFVSVVITYGPARIWESSDCVQGSGSRAVTLTRGVPVVLQASWDRETSAPGCRGTRRPARLGTYTATALSGRLHSNTLVIVLAGPGVGAP